MRTLILLLLSLLTFFACSKKVEIEVENSQTTNSQITTIKENISFVKAKILEINRKSDTDYSLKILILETNSDESLPNFAVVNEEITAKPRFILKENGAIDTSDLRNKRLIDLSKSKKDEVVSLTITRTLKEGWLIVDQKN